MRFLTWIILLPLALLFIVFAVANRDAVTVSFDPLPFALVLPAFVLIFAAIFIGLLAGGLAAWMAQRRWRRAARENYRKAMRLEAEVEALKAEVARRDATKDNGGTQPLIDAA